MRIPMSEAYHPDLHDFVFVLAKPKLFVLAGQNTIAKQKKKFGFGFAQNQNKAPNRAGQLSPQAALRTFCP